LTDGPKCKGGNLFQLFGERELRGSNHTVFDYGPRPRKWRNYILDDARRLAAAAIC